MKTTDYCNYKLSLALKTAGFDEPCLTFYDSNKELGRALDTDNFNHLGETYQGEWFTDTISAPTLWHAQKWLREKKGIYAYCEPNCLKKWFARAIDLAKNEDLFFDGEMFNSFEKAAEYAISAALELITKGE